MAVGELCTREIVIARPDESVETIAGLMRRYHVGDVIIVQDKSDEERIPLGIVTDRDLVLEVMAAGVSPAAVTAGDVMSSDLVTVHQDEDLWDATGRMRAKGVRRIVVVDERQSLIGLLATDDVLDVLAEEMSNLAQLAIRERETELRKVP